MLGTITGTAGQYKTITIDGQFTDWAGVPVAATDAAEGASPLDFTSVYLANDDAYLYVRVRMANSVDYSAYNHHVFIDADADLSTGFSVAGIGSELMIENGGGYTQQPGQWNAGGATGLDWAVAPTGTDNQFELRISRAARDATGNPIFSGTSIAVAIEAEDSNWAAVDVAPDSGGVAYEFASAPSKATGTTNLISLAGAAWSYLDSGEDLGTNWLADDYDPTQTGWQQGSGLFGFGATAGTYPAIATPLASGRNTYYLRVPFTWDYDNSGIALVVSNYLSDGAVFYLNGLEVKRVRLAEGAVTYATSATGGPATPGQAEFFALPAEALVTGANVLEVEVHQAAATPNELVFGLRLDATDSLAPSIDDASLPADRSVTEGDATTFSVGKVSGSTPLAYQWYKDGAAIDGATNATFAIDVVLAGDAGTYYVEISNATGKKATSRTAQLTTTAVPITLANEAEPADRTILQGESTTFAVTAAGSPVIYYQWFKDSAPIAGATHASWAITNAVLSDAGLYSVTVSNRANAVASRSAKLVVNVDAYPPTIAQVNGSGKKVVIEFSEPLDPATAATPGNYTLTGGAQVAAASLEATDPRTVTLTTTAALNFGAVYTLSVHGVKDRFNNSASATAMFRATILIDGDLDDWSGIAPATTETQDTLEGMEFKDITITNDDSYIYIRMSFYANVGQLGVDSLFHIFSDTDNDAATGYATTGIGSEMMIENATGYQQKNGQFNEGGVGQLDFAIGPAAAGSDFECRISRQAIYTSDGQKVYGTNTMALTFQLISGTWAALDSAPAAGGLVYTLVNFAPLQLGALKIQAVSGKPQISWTGAGVLQTATSLTGTWETLDNAASPYQPDTSASQRFFRLKSE